MKNSIYLRLLTCVFVCLVSVPAIAATWTGNANDHNWFTGGNWDTGSVPGPGNTVYLTEDLATISSGSYTSVGTVTVNTGATGKLTVDSNAFLDTGLFYVGSGSGNSGKILVEEGATIFASTLHVGYDGGSGEIEINGGEVRTSYWNFLNIGYSGYGQVTVNNNGLLNSTWDINVGSYGTGVLVVNSGTAQAGAGGSDWAVIIGGYSSGAPVGSGTAIINGGLLQGGDFYVGRSGTGTLEINNDGKVIVYGWAKIGGDTYEGMYGTGYTTVNDQGVMETRQSLYVATGGTAALTINQQGQVLNKDSAYIGYYTSGVGTVTVNDNGLMDNQNDLLVGVYGSGTLVMTGGTIRNGRNEVIGSGTGSQGSVLVGGSGNMYTTGTLYVGNSGTGRLTVTDNGFVSNGGFGIIGTGSSSTGSVLVSGQGEWQTAGLYVGNSGSGILEISGSGKVNNTGSGIIGVYGKGVGSVTVTDHGQLTSNGLFVGYSGTGSLNVNGGAVLVGGTVVVAANTTANGAITLRNGGLLAAQGIVKGSGDGSLDFDGGVLSALSDNSDFIANLATVGLAGDGGTINTNEYNISINNVFSGSGSLIKQGSGTLTLGAVNSYTGNTVVSGGALVAGVQNAIASSGALIIQQGALFDMNGLDQNVGRLVNDGLVNFSAIGKTLTVDGELSGNGSFKMDVDIAAGYGDRIDALGVVDGNHQLLITNLNSDNVTGNEAPLLVVQTTNGVGAFSGTAGIGMFNYALENGTKFNLSANNGYLGLTHEVSSGGSNVLAAAAAQSMGWLTQLDTLGKRMGELRLNHAANPASLTGGWLENAWVRSYGQQVNFGSKVSGTPYREQLYGVDLGTDKAWQIDAENLLYTGVFIGYGSSDRDLRDGFGSNGNTDSYYTGFYGTWLHDSGWYADLVGKAQYFDNSFNALDASTNSTTGEYNNWGMGISLEVGKQFKFKDGWFAEPQAQISYVHFTDANYRTGGDNQFAVSLGDADVVQFRGSLILGRTITFAKSQSIIQPYIKVGGVEQISNGGYVRASGSEWRPNLDGARGVIGAGIVYQLDDRNQLHFDYEASFGDKYDKPWGLNFGYRHQF